MNDRRVPLSANDLQMIQMARDVQMAALQLRLAIEALLASNSGWLNPATADRLGTLGRGADEVQVMLRDVPVNVVEYARQAIRAAQQE